MNYKETTPLYDTEIEQACLGVALMERQAVGILIELVPVVEVFYHENHQIIYQALRDMFAESEPIDLLTVTNRLRKEKNLEKVGGAFAVTSMTSRVNSSTNLEFHSRILTEFYAKRKIMDVTWNLHTKSADPQADAFTLLDEVDKEMVKLSIDILGTDSQSLTNQTADFLKKLQSVYQQDGVLTGVHSGSENLDTLSAGWQRTDLIILAARPSMGKTALTCSLLIEQILAGLNVVFFTLEMSAIQLIQRMISIMSGVDLERIRKGQVHDNEYEQIKTAKAIIDGSGLHIIDSSTLSVIQAKSHLNRIRRKMVIDCAYFDYIQLMSEPDQRVGNREQEIAKISRGLKGLAKEMDIPVVALAQLSRQVEQRGGDKKPMLSDLRESGSIEQDADMVNFLWRPEYYGFEADSSGKAIPPGYTELICQKFRNGNLFTHKMTFLGKLTKFVDYKEESIMPTEAKDVDEFWNQSKD